MLVDGKDYLIRKSQTIEDILRNQQVIELPNKKEMKEEVTV